MLLSQSLPPQLPLKAMKQLHIPTTLSALACALLSGCAPTTSPKPLPASSNIPVPESVAPTPQANPSPSLASIEEPAINEAVTLTVHSQEKSTTLTRNLSNYQQGSGYESYTEVPADQGGEYLIVKTTVENTGQAAMDLTCSFPIDIVAFDDQNRTFTPVEKSYEIQGNPECNKQLQPGFSSEMTYAFLIPQDAKITGIAFRNTSMNNPNRYVGVDLNNP